MTKQPLPADLLAHLEHRASLLKERIYGTIILLAVLVSIDPGHTSPFTALLIVAGTVISIWAASIVAAQMSRRIIMQRLAKGPEALEERFIEHAPLLAAGAFPVFLLGLSALSILPLAWAVNAGIIYGVFLMLLWSLLSAKAMGAKKYLTLFVASIELLIGLGIVALKLAVGH